MAAVAKAQTTPPEGDVDPVIRLLELLASGRPVAVVGQDPAERVTLPPEIVSGLRELLRIHLRQEDAAVTPIPRLLTTTQAAKLLDISRPTFVSLLTSGVIRFEMVGSHRRVALTDLIEYRHRVQRSQRQALDELSTLSTDLQLYDDTEIDDGARD